jgi:hypothetical protein
MSRESDWHVFDKACDVTAMALRGAAADGLQPSQAGDLFREVFGALREAAAELEQQTQKAGF